MSYDLSLRFFFQDDIEGSKSNGKELAALENLQQQMDTVRQQLFDTAQQVRAVHCGQDRYRVSFWYFYLYEL